MSDDECYTLDEAHLQFAKRFNGRVWALLEKKDRTLAESEEMLLAAYASFYHWTFVGSEVHRQRGVWMIAHVYSALGEAEQALRYAERCLAFTEAHREKMEDFDIAYAFEAVARANALAGNEHVAEKYLEMAKAAGETIADPESKAIFMGDLDSGEWLHT